MRAAWARLGLRGRLATSIAAIVVVAFAVVFVAVRAEMSRESSVIRHEESREDRGSGSNDTDSRSAVSPIADAHSDVETTFLVVGVASLVTAIDAGDLTPRLDAGPASAVELRALADAFNHMLDRLDIAFAQQRRFVSDASHELRSPLTAVRGQLEVLGRSEQPDRAEVARVEALALTELSRVERLVDGLLALARLDEGEGPNPRGVDAKSFLAELAAGSGAEIGDLTAGSLTADPDLIAQVVRNLLENARRHAGPSGRVELGSVATRDGGLRVNVDDDGPGVPPAERDRVFGRFHRSDASRDRASGGSGLGLAISRAIVSAHGGSIWIEDSPLGGARVCFTLPRFERE
jgi:two-component system OmpR family sensor kinase